MFLMCEMSSEAGPLRREGLVEREREVRAGLEVFLTGVSSSVLRDSGRGCEDSLIARKLGDHLELSVGSRVCAVGAAAVPGSRAEFLCVEPRLSGRFWGAGQVLDWSLGRFS